MSAAQGKKSIMVDGNEAVAQTAYLASDVIAIYPITPASPMGELADQWAAEGRQNLWGNVPQVVEMQSEAGAAGAVHGALQAGALATTFTASQGLLLMIPNMYKIAGELTPAVFHIAARSLATQGLSIFCDHSDVMAARGTGFSMLCSGSVQEAADLAVVAHTSTLESRIPCLHFFDGFRTSHEINRIELPSRDVVRAMIDDARVADFRQRALSPDRPFVRGTSQNPDVYFQSRETVNPYHLACPTIFQQAMDQFADLTGRQYHLCDYFGAEDARSVIVVMGSAGETIEETVAYLNARGERVGCLRVRLFRPFPVEAFLAALPRSVERIAVLDRTKEPGSAGEPLYLDVVAAMEQSGCKPRPHVIGGRYGLGSKEFTPAMVKAVYMELGRAAPKHGFTVGIADDVTWTSIDYDPAFDIEPQDRVRALFYGLGSDGTVGANKATIKIIGEETDLFAQGFFVYDSKKSGSMTVSHLRFGTSPIRSTYLIDRASFVACSQFGFLERVNVLGRAEDEAVFLLNSPYGPDQVWAKLPRAVQAQLIHRRLKLYVIDADRVARESGLPGRISTIMQACFFTLSGVLPREQAIASIKRSIEKNYGKRGQATIDKNFAAVDAALANLHSVAVSRALSELEQALPRLPILVPGDAPAFVRNVTARLMAGEGDQLPVSAFPADGTYPSGTTKWEKRAIAREIPVWDPNVCIQCGKCVLVCPHAVIRAKRCQPDQLASAPASFVTAPARWVDHKSERYVLETAPDDCTGCGLCVEVCPAKNKSETRLKAINMQPVVPLRERARANWDYFLTLPEAPRGELRLDHVKDLQLAEPLFEFSGACAGCGETPYLKMLTQLFGDRMLVANATGCSSIYGGNLPTTPWSANRQGRGPAWSNSLFEDNAEFGLGMRIAVDHQHNQARELVTRLAGVIGQPLADELLAAEQIDEDFIAAQRQRVSALKARLAGNPSPDVVRLMTMADALVKKSVWIVGGDGWAYDIGFGGLDHVLASGRNVNVLVLDTEVYSNTGGQMSKATPMGAVAKFAAGGKGTPKKDLALMAMSYGSVYVARVAFGASDAQTIQALREAESYDGPSLVIAYAPCIAHGYDLIHGLEQQKAAAQSGHWPLMRYDPRRADAGKNPLVLDSKAPSIPLAKYTEHETRYTLLSQSQPEAARQLLAQAQHHVQSRWRLYEGMAAEAVPARRPEKQENQP